MKYKAIRAHSSIRDIYSKLAVYMGWGWWPIGELDKFKKGPDTDYVLILRKACNV